MGFENITQITQDWENNDLLDIAEDYIRENNGDLYEATRDHFCL